MHKRKFPKRIIMKVLKKHPEGLTFREIAKHSKMSRLTATKYIYELVGEERIYQRIIGTAKLCYFKNKSDKAV